MVVGGLIGAGKEREQMGRGDKKGGRVGGSKGKQVEREHGERRRLVQYEQH